MNCRYFLGANSAKGFFSLYKTVTDDGGIKNLNILKGGPGSGKSSFMKRLGVIAEEQGFDVEYIFCSGDPGSLDGIVIRELGTAFLDGTSPHVIEPRLPGLFGRYIDLSGFCRDGAISAEAEIKRCNDLYKAEYVRAYRYMSAAGEIVGDIREVSGEVRDSAAKKALSLSSRYFRRGAGRGKIRYEFIDALTCFGRVDLLDYDSGSFIAVENEYGAASSAIGVFLDRAVSAGYDAVGYMDPLTPEIPKHLHIPELSLTVVSTDRETAKIMDPEHRISADKKLLRTLSAADRSLLRESIALRDSLIDRGIYHLNAAHLAHDELEKAYNPYVDFDGVLSLAENTAKKLF